jgi:butyryl-CoA dehydrogenase
MIEKTAIVREFCKEWITPNIAEIDAGKCCPDYIWDAWCENPGFASPCAPKHAGGPEMPFATCCAMWEELARADLGCATSFGINNLGSYPVLLAGNEAQQKEHFGNLLQGKFGAFGLTEKGAGSDAGAVATEAVKKGDKYIINGGKIFTTNSGFADICVVFAMTDKTIGTKGISAFIVPLRDDEGNVTPGVTISENIKRMGIRAASNCEVSYENVRVPAERLLGKEGQGFKIAMKALDGGRIGIAAQAVGLAQGAIDEAMAYVKERKQFGRPISAFQTTQFKLADMQTKVDAARLLTWRAACIKDAGENYSSAAAMAKLFASSMANEVCREAVQLMGGYGYCREYPVERALRDAKITEIYEGTSEVMKMVISGAMKVNAK